MFCHNCGQRLGEGTRFCPICGADQTLEQRSEQSQTPAAEQQPEASCESSYTAEQEQTYTADSEPSYSAGPEQSSDSQYNQDFNNYQTYGTPNGYNQGNVPPTPENNSADGMAIAGLVLAIVGGIFTCCFSAIGAILCIVGIIMSAIGKKSQKHHTMAVISLILNIVFLVVAVASIVLSALMIYGGLFSFSGWEQFFEDAMDMY